MQKASVPCKILSFTVVHNVRNSDGKGVQPSVPAPPSKREGAYFNMFSLQFVYNRFLITTCN
jgi:hypothetical protein